MKALEVVCILLCAAVLVLILRAFGISTGWGLAVIVVAHIFVALTRHRESQ